MGKITPVILLFLLAISCKKVEKEPLGPTDIRIRNLSTSVMTNLTVNTGGGEFDFGTLNGGETTEYHRFDEAYPKANITAMVNGQKYKTDTAIYTYMQYLGTVKATYEIRIKSDINKSLEISDVVLESDLK